MKNNINTLVFDWNGTLLEDTWAIHYCANLILKRYGRPTIDIDTFRDLCDVPFERMYLNFGFSESDVEKLTGGNNTIFHDNYEPLADQSALREGAEDALKCARTLGMQIIILSNHLVGSIKRQLHRLKIDSLIDDVLAYPNREVQFIDMTKCERLQRFMAEKKIKPERVAIIGDTSEEIKIARSLHLCSIAITGGVVSEPRLHAAEPDRVVHSLNELIPFFSS